MNRPDVGVVIVTYNSGDVIGRCLDRCRDLKTLVVDNASSDSTVEQARARPWVRVIANQENRGFAAAVNQGVRELRTSLVLLLNPDVELLTSLDRLAEACAGAGMAAGQLVDQRTGQPQAGFTVRRFPTPVALILEVLGLNRVLPWTPVNRRYRCRDLDLIHTALVEQPAGAFLMFRHELWERLGGFDERFFPVWFEDVDFCKRATEAGAKIWYIPGAKAAHRGGDSVGKLPQSRREVYWYGSLLRYASKHFSSNAFRAVSAAVVLGCVLRAWVGVARRWSREPWAVYAPVISLAKVCLATGQMPKAKIASPEAVG